MIIQNSEFRELKNRHAKETLLFLLDNIADEFDMLCVKEDIGFNPALPEHIASGHSDMIMFSLANYTLSTAKIENDSLIFEAGFGEENFGSVVTVPIENILQITQFEAPLFINPTATLPKPKKEDPKNPFAMNPRNKRFMDE